jgi:hypothetical protein
VQDGYKLMLGTVIVLMLAFAPGALAKDAPGNNGTVKIHSAGEAETTMRNEPHVGCDFHMDFFFGDSDQTGIWEIQSWPPTGDGTVVASGTYDATGDGQDRESASLPGGHYKLFWDGDTGKNDKHKTFWVDCPDGGGGGGGGGGEG